MLTDSGVPGAPGAPETRGPLGASRPLRPRAARPHGVPGVLVASLRDLDELTVLRVRARRAHRPLVLQALAVLGRTLGSAAGFLAVTAGAVCLLAVGYGLAAGDTVDRSAALAVVVALVVVATWWALVRAGARRRRAELLSDHVTTYLTQDRSTALSIEVTPERTWRVTRFDTSAPGVGRGRVLVRLLLPVLDQARAAGVTLELRGPRRVVDPYLDVVPGLVRTGGGRRRATYAVAAGGADAAGAGPA